MRVYFDSSAFAKRYIDEPGTEEVLAWCDRATELALSVIAIPEIVSAFCRLRRERRITAGQYRSVRGDLMADIADAVICDTSPEIIQRAVQTLEGHPLRAMDAIHVGAAVVSASEVFVSADARQCAAAKALGLRVIAL